MSLTKVSYSMIGGGFANVIDFGAATTNTDVQNGAAFQAAIDSLKNIGGTVLIPSGTFNITSISMPDETYNGIRVVVCRPS
jgi:polygalacturonase